MGSDLALTMLGNAVRARRRVLGLSQEELAERADMHRNYVGGIERGERNISYLNLLRLARALDYSAPALTLAASPSEEPGLKTVASRER
jgi:transcriptional regulator with XRE-family HTH domain